MRKIDAFIILGFFVIIGVLYYSLNHIKTFMPILKTCEDDFAVINKCACVPCSWQDAEKYNGNFTCLFYRNISNFKNG